jgi:hypothetical protein
MVRPKTVARPSLPAMPKVAGRDARPTERKFEILSDSLWFGKAALYGLADGYGDPICA